MTMYRRWLGAMVAFVLVSLLFMVLKPWVHADGPNIVMKGEISLLWFVIPGFIASYASVSGRIFYPFLGTFCAVLVSTLIHLFYGTELRNGLQMFAYGTSALFWSTSGAFLFWFVALSWQKKRSIGAERYR